MPGDSEARAPAVARRNLGLLLGANITATTGIGVTDIALVYLIYTQTGSALYVSFLALAFVVPALTLGLFAGALVDRVDRRRLMVLSDLGRAASILVIPISLWFWGFQLALVVGIAFVIGGLGTFFRPASNAFLPSIVEPAGLERANGWMVAGSSIAGTLANAAGAALVVTVGVPIGLGYNAATYAVSGILISLIAVPLVAATARPAGSPAVRRSLAADLAEGMRYLRGKTGLLELTLSSTLVILFIQLVFPFFVVFTAGPLHLPPHDFGYLLAGFGGGVALGSLNVQRTGFARRLGLAWSYSTIVIGAFILLIVAFPYWPVAAATMVVTGTVIGLASAAFLATVQKIVPPELLGRYFSLDEVLSLAASPIGLVLGGTLIQLWGISTTYLFAGAGTVVLGVSMLFLRDLRELGAPVAAPRPAPDPPP